MFEISTFFFVDRFFCLVPVAIIDVKTFGIRLHPENHQ